MINRRHCEERFLRRSNPGLDVISNKVKTWVASSQKTLLAMTTLFISTLFFASSTFADQLIIEPDMGRAPIIQAIHSTKHDLNIVMYGFTDKTLLDAVLHQKSRGRTVKIILEKSPYRMENENARVFDALEENRIPWVDKIPPFRLIHQKTMIIDGKKAIVMTFNFTSSTFKKMRNLGLILDDPKDVAVISEHFASDWNQHEPNSQSDHLIWSPDDSRDKMISLIKQARHSIDIYAQSISDKRIIEALEKAAHKNIRVRILTSSHLNEKTMDKLMHAGVQIEKARRYYIHAKVIVIDNKQAVIGSINLTRSSLDDNRELSVLTADKMIVNQLHHLFDSDWSDSTS